VDRKRKLSLRRCMAVAFIFAIAAAGIGTVVGVRSLRAAGGATISVNPASEAEVWPRAIPTPLTFTINAASLSGAGLTPVEGYQYGLTWDPTVLRWLSGPQVGPGTPIPAPVLPCSNSPQIVTWGTATATPTGFVPTYTPTPTRTSTPTNTPLALTATNTPTQTFTPSITPTFTPTPTPGGYIFIGCASFSGTPAAPAGTIGSFKFQPIASGPVDSAIALRDVLVVDNVGNALNVTTSDGLASLVQCADMNGDKAVNGLDLGLLAGSFGLILGQPGYLAAADLTHDNAVNGLDLGVLAGAFGLTC
jgi:hypothetical protein